MAEDTEFQDREARIPGQMGGLIAAFLKELTNAEYENRTHYAEFVQAVLKKGAIDWAVQAKILTIDQSLTLMAKLPAIAFVPLDYLGVTTATQDMEFRVSATRSDTSSLGAHAESKTTVGVGGIAALFGAKGSTTLTAGTTYQKDTRRESDYSSTVKVHIEVGRIPPPETVAFMNSATNEIVKASVDINKTIIQKQAGVMDDKAKDATAPKELPQSESGGGESGGGSGDEAGGGGEAEGGGDAAE